MRLGSLSRLGAAQLVIAGLLWISLGSSQGLAQEESAAQESWDISLNAGINLVRGNSKSLILDSSLLAEYARDPHELRLQVGGNYGESSDETSVQNAVAQAAYKCLFSERNYAYLHGELRHDRIADIDYRAVLGPGLGRYLCKSARQSLSLELGAAYVRQVKQDEPAEDTANLRVAQYYEIKLPANAKLWEMIEVLPAFEDFDNFLLNCELGAEAALSERVNLRLVFTDKFNNQPATDKQRNDLQLIGGVGIKL